VRRKKLTQNRKGSEEKETLTAPNPYVVDFLYVNGSDRTHCRQQEPRKSTINLSLGPNPCGFASLREILYSSVGHLVSLW
jgi:hypothetical protein